MTTQEIGFSPLDEVTTTVRPLAMRALIKVVSVVALIARVVADEVVYMIREDAAHGRIQREPEDWER